MSNADSIFWRRFGAILIALHVFGVAVAFIARDIAGDAFRESISHPATVAERLSPTGSVRIGDPLQVVAPAPPRMTLAAAAPAAIGDDGESVYNAACVACHQAGVAGAPKLGDEQAWAPRLAQGHAALVASVVNGKGAMPPKGGNASLSEAQIDAAVTFMVERSSAGGARSGAAPAGAAGTAQDTARAAAETAAAVDKPAASAAPAADKAPAAAGTAAGAAHAAAAGGKPGDEVYTLGCVACHATGAANAPKLDDKAAWEARAAQGEAHLVASVVNGKGAMPPKGGLVTLTEADIANAVRYMLEQAGVAGGG